MIAPRIASALITACLLATACTGSEATTLEGCTPAELATRTKGKITFSTGVITRSPWVSGPRKEGRSADPRNGKGYDAAVGFELARRLGFARSEVTWLATPFADALAPGSKRFDVNVNQITIRDDRAKNVDFSSPYYAVRHAVVGLKGGRAVDADSVEDLRRLRLAYRSGSMSERAVREAFGKDVKAVGYPDDNKLRGALTEGAADAIVTTYLTALRFDSDETQLVDGELLGVLAGAPSTEEKFGLVLEKSSTLTRCVDEALRAMQDDGTLERLERTWLVEEQGWHWFE